MKKGLNNFLQIFSIFSIVGSLFLLIIIGVAYIDKFTGGEGWIISLFGFIFLLATLVAFIISIVKFFMSLSNERSIELFKNRLWYWFILVFIIIFILFVKVMKVTGNG